MDFNTNRLILLELLQLYVLINSTIVKTNVDIYCSSDFLSSNRYLILCKWLHENADYLDTYDAALNDCPSGFMLAGLTSQIKFLNNFQQCGPSIQVWINEIFSNGKNIASISTNDLVTTSKAPVNTRSQYFLCTNSSQTFNCKQQEIFSFTDLTCSILYEGKPCLLNDMCNSSLFCINQSCTLPKSCKEIQKLNPNVKSGIYHIQISGVKLEVYCEMDINDGGYTFFPWSSIKKINTSMINEIYTNRSHVIFRIMNKQQPENQNYTVMGQLSSFKLFWNVSVQINENIGYNDPKYSEKPYFYFGFIPKINATSESQQGFSSNDQSITFNNCDKNPNSYFLMSPKFYSNSQSSAVNRMVSEWIGSSKPHPQGSMPTEYFYFTEIHQGGCGVHSNSSDWTPINGTAFGIK